MRSANGAALPWRWAAWWVDVVRLGVRMGEAFGTRFADAVGLEVDGDARQGMDLRHILGLEVAGLRHVLRIDVERAVRVHVKALPLILLSRCESG